MKKTEQNGPPAPPDLVRAVSNLNLRYALMDEKNRNYFGLLNLAGDALALAEVLFGRARPPFGRRYRTLRPLPADARKRVRQWTRRYDELVCLRERDDEGVCRMIEGTLSLCESLLPADQEPSKSSKRSPRRKGR